MDRGSVADWASLRTLALAAPNLRRRTRSIVERVEIGFPGFWLALLASMGEPVVELIPSVDFGEDALELAMLTGGSFYDALYVAVSERQNLRVVTADSRMIKAFDRLQGNRELTSVVA